MSFLKNRWALATLVVLCWTVAAFSALGYYYYQYKELTNRIESAQTTINLGIDYANGTRVWYNGTRGVTLYDAMMEAGWEVKGKSYGVMGLYVTSINGVEESAEQSRYWSWWTWTEYGWAHGGSACDKYVVSDGETIIWYYSYCDPKTWELSPPP